MNLARIGLILLFALLQPGFAIAGEIYGTLPSGNDEAVISLHALQQQLVVKVQKKSVVLHQKGRMFSPALTVIPVGSRVDMTNDDVVYHNVFSFSKAKTFDLGLYPYGGHKSVLFDKTGEVKIFCAVHPNMHAVVLVMDTPWFKRSTGKKEFRFSDIPAGQYEIHLWRKNQPLLISSKFKVTQTGRTSIDLTDQKAGASN
ncbi:hypothetical protein MMIC_P0638 [Mariprofundus micogutta]|uniref:Methylamine utilization protein n=1 Tax=Mariprofundus micogutta TaxID=1921010 RepID=A0A1L8CL93_9PROT|nr:hypothetical protein [Mariprofundus micogutta]GAV19687.1 hypothetical protein MMIC_P0638 [Mariprofundus micogutta]